MKVGLIHYTEDYHKLCETVARVCYQSYHKDDEKSHNFIKAIMAKGHISIASTGNMVFGIAMGGGLDEFAGILSDLHTIKEINPFIKTTIPDAKKNPDTQVGFILSMNMLAFLDIYKKKDEYDFATKLVDMLFEITDKVPELRWFYDKNIILPEKKNQYTAKGTPDLYKPIILEQDYTILKEKGLTEYELGIHSQVTVNFLTDRSAGLQFWRHTAGGCELSQRYVSRGDAKFRDLVGLQELIAEKLDVAENKYAGEAIEEILGDIHIDIMNAYDELLKYCKEAGIHAGRAKEIARSILPNSITTQLIQNRPLRYWLHLLDLRDTSHAQKEIRADVIEIKKAFDALGIPNTQLAIEPSTAKLLN